MAGLTDKQRAARNLNPHAEAIAAMHIWSHEYAHEQRGGSMDFWDSIGASRQRICREMVDAILAAKRANLDSQDRG